jgi:hypothetical protein
VSKYLHSGWHEFFIAVRAEHGSSHLRIWIDMEDVVPLLRRLDLIYGDEDHPYAMDAREIPDAQRKLLEMVTNLAIARPEAVRRAAAPRRLARELADRFGIGPSDYPVAYPPAIDQVDLDPAQAMFALPFIVDRDSIAAQDRER